MEHSRGSPSRLKRWLEMLAFLKPYRLRFIGGLLCALLYGLTSAVLGSVRVS